VTLKLSYIEYINQGFFCGAVTTTVLAYLADLHD